MSEVKQTEKSAEMQQIEDKMTMLVQTGRIDNLIDLLAVVSDQIEMTTTPIVEKMVHSIDNMATAGFVTENAVRYAKRESAKNEVPSLFGMLKLLKDEDTRKGLAFMLNLTKGIGKQI
ncbi:MAG: DUF1641 domain-containing protein [Sulfurimonas sp.]|jgi:uncharacterized protein YjgD (DUF1641 family)|nr:DUF1641 domain-containing protein [Sulfurimonas sp.]